MRSRRQGATNTSANEGMTISAGPPASSKPSLAWWSAAAKQGGRLPTTHLPALRRRVACVILKRWNHHPTGRAARRGRIDERRPRNNGMLDAATILAIAGTFLLAGAVKGVIGLGLPTVSLALLAVAINLPNAMALLLVPSFVTNVWQAMVGGHGWALLRRIWLFLLVAAITVRLGASALTRVDLSLLSALLGLLLVAYAAANLVGLRFQVQARHERWVGPLVGLVNGVLTGMTGSFVVPGVMFLQALGLSRDALIQAMGMLFTVSTLALGFALQANGLLRLEHGALSTMALLPAEWREWSSGNEFEKNSPSSCSGKYSFSPCLRWAPTSSPARSAAENRSRLDRRIEAKSVLALSESRPRPADAAATSCPRP